MIYRLVRPLARMAIRVYFRKIYLSHAERIPVGKPVLLACNHPTGFMEPCILACFLDRPLYFLVRGDFFAKAHFERMLRALHMLPVFRLRDGGYGKLKANYDTFQACYGALRANRSIMIFAEGSTKLVKQLRPLQKGIARIAFGSLEAFPELEDVYVVPVGVTYSDVNTFRSKVMIDCGEPIRVRSLLPAYEANANEGMNALLDRIAEGMRACMVHVEDAGRLELADQLLALQDSQPPPLRPPTFSASGLPLLAARKLIQGMQSLDRDQLDELGSRVGNLHRDLAKAGLSDRAVWPARPAGGAEARMLGLSRPLAWLGWWLNLPPIWWIRSIVDRRVQSKEFKAPVMVAGGLGIYLVEWLLLVLLLALFFGWPWVLLAVLPPLLGWLYVWRRDRVRDTDMARRWQQVPEPRRQRWQEERRRILQQALDQVVEVES